MVLDNGKHNRRNGNNIKTKFLIRIVFIIAIIVLVLDTSISNVSDLLDINSVWLSIPVFTIVMILSFGIAQYFILGHVQNLINRINKSNKAITNTSAYRLSWFNRTVVLTQYYIITPIVVLVVLEVIIASYYHPILITLSMSISYLLSIIIFSLLSIRFFHWFLKSDYNKNSISKSSRLNESKKDTKYNDNKNSSILFYALASTGTTIAVILTLVFYDSIIISNFRNIITAIVYVNSPIIFPTFDPNSMMSMTNSIYSLFNIISFLLLWTSSVLLLRQYTSSRRFGRLRFSFLLIAPLLFFLSQFVVLTIPSAESDAYLVTSYTLQGLVAGLLFGMPFLAVSRSITAQQRRQGQGQERHTQTPIQDYLSLSAYGFILFFVSGTATLVHTPYPPFGLASVSFVGLSSYLIFVGLYYSAVAVSQDSSLRQSIRRFALAEREGGRPKLLDSIGTAQMQQDIENRVTKLVKEQAHNINNQTGVYLSPTEADIKRYLNDAITEISKAKEQERKKDKG